MVSMRNIMSIFVRKFQKSSRYDIAQQKSAATVIPSQRGTLSNGILRLTKFYNILVFFGFRLIEQVSHALQAYSEG